MIAIPFIYFTVLAYHYYRKAHQVNLAVYIAAIYAVSGLFSILMDLFKLRGLDTVHYQLSLLPTIVYCLSITMIILPVGAFAKYYSGRIQPLDGLRVLILQVHNDVRHTEGDCSFWIHLHVVLSVYVV